LATPSKTETPKRIIALYNHFHNLLFRLKDIYDGTGVYRIFSQLRKEQYLPPDELEDIRSQRLRRVLIHAHKNSLYYRDVFKSHDINIDDSFDISRLSQLPLLTRQQLQVNYENILCQDAKKVQPDSSGGSTGQPVNFYHDANYVSHSRALRLLFHSWMDIKPGDKTAIFWGADRDLNDATPYEKRMNRLNRIKQLNSFAMTDDLVAGFIDEINCFKPKYIYGYASSLYHVAKFIVEHKPLTFQPKAVRSSAEMLYDFQRKEIESAFKTRVFNFYGSREVNNIAAECPTHDGLHIFASARIVEIVDENGKSLPPGEEGNIAVTDLTNFSFPFIRYLNGDMGELKDSSCPCRRTYPLIDRITGRSSDMIIIGDKHIHGEYFTHLFYGRPDISQFQLVQETPNSLKLYIIPKTENTEIEYFSNAILDKVGRNIKLEIIKTDRIEPTPSGKHRFTISLLREKE